MKNIVIFCILLCVIKIECNNPSVFEKVFQLLHKEPLKPLIKERKAIITKWIEQKVDNFNESDSRTWKMRYMENGNHFIPGAPIFIFVGGEWEISPSFIQGGHMYDMAKEHNGYLFYTEHRYYGKSFPTEDISVENLKYLSVWQSLADLAHFIKTVKNEYPGLTDSKIILVGGSYSATMVTWFHIQYPGLVTGSWSSSAPLLAKVDFIEYKEVVGQSLVLVGGQSCYDKVASAFNQIEELLKKNDSRIFKLFNICDNFDATNKLDVWSLLGSLSDVFSGLVQGHNSGNIERACRQISSKDDDLEGVASWLSNYLSEGKCNDFSYSASIKSLNHTQPTSSIMRQWFYQTCSEFGWYQTSGSKLQPFGSSFPEELYTLMCKDVFGEKFSKDFIYEQIRITNVIYGGLNPNVTRVISTHGQLDPWRSMGLQESSSGESNVIPLYAHCKDLASISSKDTKEMKASKEKVQKIITKWLQTEKPLWINR